MTKKIYVIEATQHAWRSGLNAQQTWHFCPDPGAFLTEAEAQFYCRKFSDDFVTYTYRPVRVGSFTREFMATDKRKRRNGRGRRGESRDKQS